MFGIGALEFFLIGIVALLAIGPGEMPRALYNLGRMMRKLRQFSADIQSGLDQITEEAELEDITKEANKAGDELMDFRIEQQQALEARDKKEKAEKKKAASPAKKKKTAPKKKAAAKKKKAPVKKKAAGGKS